MVRNIAENQRRYREKKKQDPEWKMKEVKRVQKYYIPTPELTAPQAQKRRKYVRDSTKKSRTKKKEAEVAAAAIELEQMRPGSSADSEMSLQDEPGTSGMLTVKFPFGKSTKDHSRKRINRGVMSLKRKNAQLTDQNDKLQKKVWRLEKKTRRLSNESDLSQHAEKNTSTPVKEADKTLRSSGISPGKTTKLRKLLAAHHSMLSGLKLSRKQSSVHVLRSSRLAKYGFARYVSKSVGVGRRVISENMKRKNCRRKIKMGLTRNSVVTFMMRSDNATCCPGKRDSIKVGREQKQKYILNDTLKNLHQKYQQENAEKSISFSTFCRMRPKHIFTVQYINRKVCLCQKHQNIALKLRALRNINVTELPLRPDSLADCDVDEFTRNLQAIPVEYVKFQEWVRVEQPYKETVIKKTTLIDLTMKKDEFVAKFVKEFIAFRRHSFRVSQQYDQIRRLRQTMPESHVTIQIDFAENYVCHFGEEVQSAYYSKEQVTIHPAVVDFRSDGSSENSGGLKHKSFVIISDETSHTSGTVFAFLKALVPKVQELVPGLDTIHYISDSPTSQYKNLNMFNITTHHSELFNGINATWQYYESGHGKGPCDGVGGAVKRSADLSVKIGILIKTATDFFNWASQKESTAVDFILVQKEAVKEANAHMLAMDSVSVTGTMTLHSIMPIRPGEAYFRETSCFKECCWSNGILTPTCSGWEKRLTKKSVEKITDFPIIPKIPSKEDEERSPPVHSPDRPTLTGYVAATYEGKTYIGQIIEFDQEDDEYYIRFMEMTGKCSGTYKWPHSPDEICLHKSSILMSVDEPIPTGKSKRIFKLSEKDTLAMEQYY